MYFLHYFSVLFLSPRRGEDTGEGSAEQVGFKLALTLTLSPEGARGTQFGHKPLPNSF
jgi:hypothetical protein